MTNIVPLHNDITVLICGCGGHKFLLHCVSDKELTLVCAECLYGINGYKVIKDELANG